MALTNVTTTLDLHDLLGVAFDVRRTKVWLTTNAPKDTIHDKSTGKSRLGGGSVTLSTAGVATATTWAPGSDANPATWQTTFHVDYVDAGTRQRVQVSFGPYTITTSGNLTALEQEQVAIPTATAAQSATAAASSATAASSSATSAASSATAAQTARTGAETARTGAEAAAALAEDISNIATPDALVETLIENPGSLTAAALSATIGVGGNINATARKMADLYGNMTLVAAGDSITTPNVLKLLGDLGAKYPHRSFVHHKWNDTSHTFDAPTTVSTGSGATTVDVWDISKGGTVWEFVYPYFAEKVRNLSPVDCFIVSYGINQGATATATSRTNYLIETRTLTNALLAAHPGADMLLVSQNPRIDAGYQVDLATDRAQQIRKVAAEVGAAYGPVCEAFLAGNTAGYLNSDGIHPNTAGIALYATTLMPLFTYTPNLQPTRTRSAIDGVLIGTNTDFAEFASPLPGWTASNVTLSKDTTRFESPNGYALRMQANAAAQSRIRQTLPIALCRGKTVTIAARMWIPAGQSNVTGRSQLTALGGVAGTVGFQSAGTQTATRDCWVWEVATFKVPSDATTLYADVIAGATNDATADITVDRVIISIGAEMRDVAPRQLPAPVYSGLRAMQSARFYTNNDQSTTGTAGVSAGWAFTAPIWIPETKTIDQLSIEVTVAQASATLTLGIYASDGVYDQPGARLVTTSALDASTTGVKTGAVSVTLNRGWHWLAALALGAGPTCRSAGATAHPLIAHTTANHNQSDNCYLKTGLAALPATWDAVPIAASGPPRMLIRTA